MDSIYRCTDCGEPHPNVRTHRYQGRMKGGYSAEFAAHNKAKQARHAQNKAVRAQLQKDGKI